MGMSHGVTAEIKYFRRMNGVIFMSSLVKPFLAGKMPAINVLRIVRMINLSQVIIHLRMKESVRLHHTETDLSLERYSPTPAISQR
jgi:hypothetical protein